MSQMRMDLGQVMRPEQRLILAPRMIQSMEILQLPIMALQERIEQELQENPVLEVAERTEEAAAEEAPAAPAEEKLPDPDGELVIDPTHDEFDFNRLEALNRDWEDHFNEEHRPSRNGIDEETDRKHDAMQNMPSRPQSLNEYLTEQLTFLDVSPEEHERLRYLISNLDENGYLASALEELAAAYGHGITAADLEATLHLLQKLDPPGVGARDAKECLLLQLTPETPHREMLRVLILHHLEDLAHNRLPIVQRKTGFDLATIKEAIEELRRLDPRPGARFHEDGAQYVVPDVIVERNEQGDYDVKLVDDWTPPLHIPPKYYAMAHDKSADPKTKEYLKRKIQSAEWLRDAIDQRRRTLERVTRAIINHQRAFLDLGPEHIEPLKMQQIADQVGVHVTTVSRAVDDKWVQTPRGVFPLKRFFGGGTKNDLTGEDVAWETIKNKLLELIGAEDKSNPLSDEDLVAKLNEAGYPVARRTVTKYRKMRGVRSSGQRRDWTA